MPGDSQHDIGPPTPASRAGRLRQRWADLSLRTRLLLFAFVLVTLPGAIFALTAFSGARAALEREVAIQLTQNAERGADVVATALGRARADVQAWARQDVMRDLRVADLDKRVSRFLSAVRATQPPYLAVLALDRQGMASAASGGEWVGRPLRGWPAVAVDESGDALRGPLALPGFGHDVLLVGAPIPSPDPPGERIGTLLLVYDWRHVDALLDAPRATLARLGKRVAALVVDGRGAALAGVGFDGAPVRGAPAPATPDAVVRGVAPIAGAPGPWAVVLAERADEALAPVWAVRRRWALRMAVILVAGLAVAALLARQATRPLEEVAHATGRIAAHPERELPLLPVRARNEAGQLAHSFNRMTAALKASQEEALAAARFAFAGELAAMIAHEVRTPLSVLRSSAQMLAAPGAPAGDQRAELVETIVAEVDRVERVVNGLIQLARPLEPHPEATALSDLLTRAVAFTAAQAARQGVRVVSDLRADAPPALCDAEQVYQVALNLLVNALQALPAGGRVCVRTVEREAGLTGFEVSDDGPGLPAEVRRRLFQPFVTGREDGTGLGLAFVDRIVRAHRGRIAVRGERPHGTTFAVLLPIAEEQP